MTGAQGPRKDGDVNDPKAHKKPYVAPAILKTESITKQGALFLEKSFAPQPALVPHVSGSDTSLEAAESMEPHAGTLEMKVLAAIRDAGAAGHTDDELEQLLELSHQTASARRRALVIRCLVKDSGARRSTRSGRGATVWIRADG